MIRLRAICGVATACAGLLGTAGEAGACPAAPPAIRDLEMSRPYTDDVGSAADTATTARHVAEAEPLKAWLSFVTRSADAAMSAGGDAAAEAGRCAVGWIAEWARAGALLGDMTSKQAEYERKWDMTGAALAWLKVRRHASTDERRDIDTWLARLADAATHFAELPGHKRNNHWFWLGLGLGAVAIATADPVRWARAHAIYRDALTEIAADGTLRLEMARGKRALHYHAFALMPLVTLAELAASRGEDWWSEREGSLHRLVAVTLRGLADPAQFDRLAAVAQERPVNPQAGWIALYAARFPERVPAGVPASKPSHRWLGGDVRSLSGATADSRPRR